MMFLYLVIGRRAMMTRGECWVQLRPVGQALWMFSGGLAVVCGCGLLPVCVYALELFRSYPLVTARQGRGAPHPPTPAATLGAPHAIRTTDVQRQGQGRRQVWMMAKLRYRCRSRPRASGDRGLSKQLP